MRNIHHGGAVALPAGHLLRVDDHKLCARPPAPTPPEIVAGAPTGT